MAVQANGEFVGVPKDTLDKFHGNQLVYFGWDKHLMYYAPICLALPPATTFRQLIEQILPGCWGKHPDFAKIEWAKAQWTQANEAFTPELDKSLAEHAIRHKTVIRLATPGLEGLAGAAF